MDLRVQIKTGTGTFRKHKRSGSNFFFIPDPQLCPQSIQVYCPVLWSIENVTLCRLIQNTDSMQFLVFKGSLAHLYSIIKHYRSPGYFFLIFLWGDVADFSWNPFVFLPHTENIFRQSIPENSWLFKTFCCRCPYEKKKKLFYPLSDHSEI